MLKSQLVDINGRALGTHDIEGVGTTLVTTSYPHSEFYMEVVRGSVPGHRMVQKFCANDSMSSGVEFLTLNGGASYTYAVVPETVDVVSSLGADVSGSTGAAEVTIYGLDGDYREIQEVIALNGAGAVSSARKYLRIYRMKCTGEVGTFGSNQGNLTLDGNVTSNVYAYIPIGYGQTQLGTYTVPANHTAFIVQGSAGINADLGGAAGTREGEIQVWIRILGASGLEAWRMMRRFNVKNTGTGTVTGLFGTPIQIDEKTDVRIMGENQSNSSAMYFEWHMVVVENEFL